MRGRGAWRRGEFLIGSMLSLRSSRRSPSPEHLAAAPVHRLLPEGLKDVAEGDSQSDGGDKLVLDKGAEENPSDAKL